MRRKPFTFQAAQEKHRRDLLAQNQTLQFAPTGRAQTYVPAIGGIGGTAPTYTATSQSYWVLANNVFTVWGWLQINSFTSAGTATSYSFSLPSSIPAFTMPLLSPLGSWLMSHAANKAIGVVEPGPSGTVILTYPATWPGGVAASVSATTPFALGGGDTISWQATIRAPDLFNP